MKHKINPAAAAISVCLFFTGLLMFSQAAEMEGMFLTTLALYSHMLGSLFSIILGNDINHINWFLFFGGHTLQYLLLYLLLRAIFNRSKQQAA